MGFYSMFWLMLLGPIVSAIVSRIFEGESFYYIWIGGFVALLVSSVIQALIDAMNRSNLRKKGFSH